jgi:hypothetical protein
VAAYKLAIGGFAATAMERNETHRRWYRRERAHNGSVSCRCPSWDEPLTPEEVDTITDEHGSLATTLGELAEMIREMDRRAPCKIKHKDTIIAKVEPTRDAALWRQLDHVSGPDWMGDGVCVIGPDWPDHIDEEEGEHCADLSWQSQATLGFLIRVLASARRLRPLLEMAANPHHARDFYVELYIGLSYEAYDEPTSGLIVRSCMKWPGTTTVQRLVESIEHWNRNVMRILATEGSTGRGGLKHEAQQPSSSEIDRLLQQDCAKAILEALGTDTLRATQIAVKAGYELAGRFKEMMALLKKHEIIIKPDKCKCVYRVNPDWYNRLEIRPDQKDER